MGKSKFTVESRISIHGAPFVPLSSLTPEQKAEVDQEIGRRIARVIERCYEEHPEDRERIRKALLDSGSKMLWEEKLINGRRCHIDYKDGQPCEPVWMD